MNEANDKTLAARASGGDEEAFSALVAMHYDGIYRLAFRWCGQREDAQDVAQEVCVKLATSLGDYKAFASLRTWIYRVTINACMDHHRRASTRAKNESAYAHDRTARDHSPNNPTAQEHALARALQGLSEKLRAAVLLVYAEGMSHKEASEVLGCAEGTVSWRVLEARKALKQALQEVQ